MDEHVRERVRLDLERGILEQIGKIRDHFDRALDGLREDFDEVRQSVVDLKIDVAVLKKPTTAEERERLHEREELASMRTWLKILVAVFTAAAVAITGLGIELVFNRRDPPPAVQQFEPHK